MRFADGPGVSVERQIGAPIADVWQHVSDISLPVGLSDELYRVEWLEPARTVETGARFRGWNRRGDREWQTVSTVTDWLEPVRFSWTVGEMEPGSGPIATWGFELDERDADGCSTLLRQWVRLGPGRSGLTAAIAAWPEREADIIAARLEQQRAAMRANLAAVDAALTSEPRSEPDAPQGV